MSPANAAGPASGPGSTSGPAAPGPTASSYYRLTAPDDAARKQLMSAMTSDLVSADFLAREQRALLEYGSGPAPLFSRLPIPYRIVPLPVRSALLSTLFRRQQKRFGDTVSPHWPVERALDDERRERWAAAAAGLGIGVSAPRYPGGRRAALILTHDIDSRAELELIDTIRVLERRHDLPSSFGFVPEVSWPTAQQAQRLVAEGGEVYFHDLRHDGKLPYMPPDAIRSAFDGVFERSPWARPLMRGFRAGQLLMSPALRSVVGEVFEYDLSVPDTERGGPFGYAAGSGTVYPYVVDSLLEIPLTLAQDIFVRHVYGFGAPQVLRIWLEKLRYIADVGGVAVLNTHPVWVNPKRPDMWQAYDAFLASVATDDRLWVTTPASLVAWLREQGAGLVETGTGTGEPERRGAESAAESNAVPAVAR